MITTADNDRISRATRMLAAGRVPGLVVAFAIPLVLARVFDPTEFGTYKQLFLIYATLFGLAQLGMAESLYYFVPLSPAQAGRHVANALVALVTLGLGCVFVLTCGKRAHRQLADQPGAGGAPRAARRVPGADAGLRGARDRADVEAAERGSRVGLCGIGYRPGGVLRGAGRHRLGPAWRARRRRPLRGGAAGGHADRAVARIPVRPARRPAGAAPAARLCIAVRAGGRHRGGAPQLASVRGGGALRRRGLCDLRGRLPPDSDRRSDRLFHGERDDGGDVGGA